MTIWTFWLPAAVITLVAAGLAVLGLTRGAPAAAAGAAPVRRDLKVYADQLREIERDMGRGVIAPDEAERLRTETARRLLEADRAHERGQTGQATGQSPRALKLLALASIPAAVALAAFLYAREGVPLYPDRPLAQRIADAAVFRAERPGQAELEARWLESPAREAFPEPDAEYAALMDQLRAAMITRPLDLQGFGLLAQNEARLGRFSEAAAAQARVLALLPADTPREEVIAARVRHVQFLIAAAGGAVSPEAEAELDALMRLDPENGFARFFVGVMFDQTGRPDLTFQIWRGLLEDSQPDDPWVPDLRAGLEPLAAVAGVRYTLPPLAAMGQRGPSQADIDAAGDLDAEGRAAMIGGMVEGLAARLASQGGPSEDWAQLIQALTVLGQRDRAQAIWTEARLVFATDPEGLARIDEAARAGGLAN